jgi:hypothetical protein
LHFFGCGGAARAVAKKRLAYPFKIWDCRAGESRCSLTIEGEKHLPPPKSEQIREAQQPVLHAVLLRRTRKQKVEIQATPELPRRLVPP